MDSDEQQSACRRYLCVWFKRIGEKHVDGRTWDFEMRNAESTIHVAYEEPQIETSKQGIVEVRLFVPEAIEAENTGASWDVGPAIHRCRKKLEDDGYIFLRE